MMRPFTATDVPLIGASLVEASAGTGKTYAITTLFVRLLLEQALSIHQILVVTFTEAATAELKQRIRTRLGEAIAACGDAAKGVRIEDDALRTIILSQPLPLRARATLEAALLNFDDASIFTIHGFCHRVLRENAFLSGASFDSELLRDVRPLVDEILGDFWASHLVDAPQFLIEYLRKEKLSHLETATRSFANSVAQRLDLRVLPNRLPKPRPIDPAEYLSAHQTLATLFDPAEIQGLLLGDSLKKNVYQPRYVPGWCAQIAEFLRQAPSIYAPDCLSRIGTLRLQQGAKSIPPAHPAFDACDRLLDAQAALLAALAEHRVWTLRTLLEFVQTEVGQRKRARNALSFDDLLLQLERALDGSDPTLRGIIRTRYPAALLDEFQDTDPIQLSIFRKLYGQTDSCVFLIGDPKQAIYSFRGADLHAYLDAANGVPKERRYTMGTNHRSDALLVRAVNNLFGGGARPFLFSELQYPEVEPKSEAPSELKVAPELEAASLVFRFFDGQLPGASADARHVPKEPLPNYVANEICRTLMSESTLFGRRLSPRDFAVLTRTNKEAFECQAALALLRVPSVVLGDRSVYEYQEARELQLLLSAVLEPGDSAQLRVALTTQLIGLGANDLLAIESNDQEWNKWIERFRSLNSRWLAEGFVPMVRQLMGECEIPSRLLCLPDGERRMTNLLHLIELIHTEATESHLGPSGVYAFLVEQQTREFAQSDSEQIRLESDEDAVVLTTIHKSKGLEYPIVVCPFVASATLTHGADRLSVRFHDQDGNGCIDLGSEDQKANQERMKAEVFAENLRLLYVALTRAQHRCVVFWGRFKGYENSALGYLVHRREIAPTPEQDPTELVDLHTAHLKALDDAAAFATLQALTRNDAGTALTPPLEARAGERFVRPAVPEPTLTVRVPLPSESPHLRTASFSELTALSHSATPHLSESEKLDPVEQSPDGLGYTPATDNAALAMPAPLTTLAAFPGGARTGNFFHTVLEHQDFEAPVDTSLVQRTLHEHGLSPDLESVAVQALNEVLATSIEPGLRLSEVPKSRRLDELEFLLPVRHTPPGAAVPLTALTRSELARVFSDHPSEALPADYAGRVRDLEFLPLKGFLKGFVDLVFMHQKRWYLVDYKTNRLGDNRSDYTPEAIRSNMSESHYCLQYHLYTLALDRHLNYRVPNYRYDKHFGGVFYLYLRGMHPDTGAQYGVYYERPPKPRLDALSRCFGFREEQAR